jgi:hypothetical protein
MTPSSKDKAISQLKIQIGRWINQDGEFRQFISPRTDTLKMLGAGNTSGALSLAVFLTAGTRGASLIIAAKVCLCIFVIGLATFVMAYRNLYLFVSDVENTLLLLRKGDKMEDKLVKSKIEGAIDRSEKSGYLVASSVACFVLGSLICFFGLLIS